MSQTFIISIEGDANASAFLQYVQDNKEVWRKGENGRRDKSFPVLFIYPTSDLEDVADRPDHRPNPKSGRMRSRK
jgi:hypothetical protein